ncbi:SDR family NAD(P)-dependent oxidoreductase [Mycolicibacterium moriokaense]|nr:SDR family NAD(P)-dependent oxidoreductase [Mycolicibacterium moriokaense]
MVNLHDRVALVTGSSRGIGAHIARRLAADGAKVILHGRGKDTAIEQVAEGIRADGGTADIVVGDLCSTIDPTRIVQEAHTRYGGLDILINNAGGGGSGPLVDQDPDQIDRALTLNLRAVILATAEFARLTTSSHGRVIVISSGAATHPALHASVYAAAKAGAEAFARSAALELGERGITVNAVAPGPTLTDMAAEAIRQQGPQWADTVSQWSALRRMGRPEDIAAVVAFLVSDEGGWVTGATVPASGGMVSTATTIFGLSQRSSN